MTPTLNIAELERLARLATPGPWAYDQCGDVWTTQETDNLADIGEVFRAIGTTPTAPDNPNAAFIASANPQTLLTLIAALREAQRSLTDDDYCKCEQDRFHPEITIECVRCKTLRSIAEKVGGL